MWPMVAMMAVGAISNAVGAKASAQAQQNAMKMQAQTDLYNAKAGALSLEGQAALDGINGQANYNASLTQAEMNKMNTVASAGLDRMFTIHNAQMEGMVAVGNATLQAQQVRAGGDMMRLDAERQGLAATTEAQVNANNARTQAAVRGIHAEASALGYDVGAIIDDNQAALFELQAISSLRRGEHKEQDVRLQMAMGKSKATARLAKGGIDLGEGVGASMQMGFDLMAENAAIEIQQSAMMEAIGQRSSAEGAKLSAAGKRLQASATRSAAAMESALAEANASFAISMAQTNAEAGRRYADTKANYNDALAQANVDYVTGMTATRNDATIKLADIKQATVTAMANAEFNANKALADAGMINVSAAVQYKHDMADIMVKNASVASMVKNLMASSISPSSAFNTAILNGATQVASAYYMYGGGKAQTPAPAPAPAPGG